MECEAEVEGVVFEDGGVEASVMVEHDTEGSSVFDAEGRVVEDDGHGSLIGSVI